MHCFKQSVKTMMALILLFALSCFLTALPFTHTFLVRNISSFYLLSLSVGLMLYFGNTVIDRKMRKYLTSIAAGLIVWFVIRVAKYACFEESSLMTRLLWYAYYVPMLGIAWLSFSASLLLGKGQSKKNTVILLLTGIFTSVLAFSVLTNDLHGWVFRFENGFVRDVQNYSRGLLFWIINGWNYLLLLVAMGIIVVKSQAASKRYFWIPLLYSVLFAFWLVLLVLDARPRLFGSNFGEFPETVCFLVGGLWLLCLKMGLVPSNSGYGQLFSVSSLAAIITDADYRIVRKSKSALPMTPAQLALDKSFLIDGNTRVYRKAVPGGYAYWQVDLTELNELNARLDDVHEALDEESELIRLENELRQKRAEIDAKSKTYDAIAVTVLPQSKAVEALVAETRQAPMLFLQNMRIVAIYICYIKRMSNLMIMAAGHSILPREELQLALAESVRYLNKVGIIATVNTDGRQLLLPSQCLVAAYGAFQKILEAALPTFQAICLTLVDNTLKITVEGAQVPVPDGAGGTYEADSDTTFLKIHLGEGAEA